MKIIIILALLYYAVSLGHAVLFDNKGSAWDKVKDYCAALAFPAWWIYAGFKSLINRK